MIYISIDSRLHDRRGGRRWGIRDSYTIQESAAYTVGEVVRQGEVWE